MTHGSCLVSCKNSFLSLNANKHKTDSPTARGATQHCSSLIGCVLCESSDVYSTYEVASWHRLGSTVDEVGSSAYGGGAVHATAEIPLMSLGAPGEGGCWLHRNTSQLVEPFTSLCAVWIFLFLLMTGGKDGSLTVRIPQTLRNAERRLGHMTFVERMTGS